MACADQPTTSLDDDPGRFNASRFVQLQT